MNVVGKSLKWIVLFGLLGIVLFHPITNNVSAVGAPGIKLISSSFTNGTFLPLRCGLNHGNVSPAFSWAGVPAGTQSLALICDDPDAPAGDWTHWVLYNIPPEQSGLAEGIPSKEILENGARQGENSFGRIGYDGPSPPSGVHRYYFRLYALKIKIDLAKATQIKLMEAMKGHILASGQMMGKYGK